MQNQETISRKKDGEQSGLRVRFFLSLALLLSSAGSARQTAPSVPAPPARQEDESALPGDWAAELLDAIVSSPNPDAQEALERAAFAAGPALVPQLEAALKDDRTAEFAAQSLSLIGGDKALAILSKLVDDPRDLDLRRFFYGALGEFGTHEATRLLLEAVSRGDSEPDRTVTEAAILALTVRSDASLVPKLRELGEKIQDVVIRDDLENATEVIELRARYLNSPEGKKPGISIDRAVRAYFVPALEPAEPPAGPLEIPAGGSKPAKPPARRPGASHATSNRRESAPPSVKVEVRELTFSPDKSRALARVVFEDPTAIANYDMVLQKQLGDWAVVSVWLGAESEKTVPPAAAPHD